MKGGPTARLLEHFINGNSIHAINSWRMLGIVNIVQVLNPLRGKGTEFSERYIDVMNEWGEATRIKEYYMTERQIVNYTTAQGTLL
jgi:hypothetical protein